MPIRSRRIPFPEQPAGNGKAKELFFHSLPEISLACKGDFMPCGLSAPCSGMKVSKRPEETDFPEIPDFSGMPA